MTPMLLPVGAIMSGIASLIIAHFRAIKEPANRQAWNVAFVVACICLTASAVAVNVPAKITQAKESTDSQPAIFTTKLPDWSAAYQRGRDKWHAKQN